MSENIVKPKREMLNYINVFRGLAILLILAGHTMQIGTNGSLLKSISFEVWAGGTALFIFISGFLFQHLSSKFEYKNYLQKKWKNVIIPYILTAIPGIILCFCMPLAYGNPFDGLNPLAQIGVFLTTGRVHNVPTWFIPMIVIFFILSYLLLYLEKKNWLYKLLPLLFLITIFLPRMDIEPSYVVNMDYLHKYIAYLKYVISGFIHFTSMYVFGMYLSKYKDRIDVFYDKRYFFIFLMIITSIADIYFNHSGMFFNGTVSKIFLTVIVLGYLKHYDELIKSHEKINHWLDVTAKYSFGLFFIHWYFVFAFNQIFSQQPVIPVNNSTEFYIATLIVCLRYLFVLFASFLTLFIIKTILKKLKIENTRSFIGV